jgi:hypothetical protein
MNITQERHAPPENVQRENGRAKRGRPFANVNAGRPRGSKNRTTVLAQALLAGEETALVRKAIELAKAGDVQMLKFLLDRLLPKDRLIKIPIPWLDHPDEAIDAMAAISGAVANGQITPTEGAALSNVISGWSRAIEFWELSMRIESLEASLKNDEAIEPSPNPKRPFEVLFDSSLDPEDDT